MVGVHEGDCLSPTLFCLVMNMYNKWINTLSIGYQLDAPLNNGAKSNSNCIKYVYGRYGFDRKVGE
jgi:hypothetical protein